MKLFENLEIITEFLEVIKTDQHISIESSHIYKDKDHEDYEKNYIKVKIGNESRIDITDDYISVFIPYLPYTRIPINKTTISHEVVKVLLKLFEI
jgi:hypothetical protein